MATDAHTTANCKRVKTLKGKARANKLRINNDCHRCLGDHDPGSCTVVAKDCNCGKGKHEHHRFVCEEANEKNFAIEILGAVTGGALLNYMIVDVVDKETPECEKEGAFWDSGASSNFVDEERAKELGFRSKRSLVLGIRTIHGVEHK